MAKNGDKIRRAEYVKATILHAIEKGVYNGADGYISTSLELLIFYLGGYAPDIKIGELTDAIIALRDEGKITI